LGSDNATTAGRRLPGAPNEVLVGRPLARSSAGESSRRAPQAWASCHTGRLFSNRSRRSSCCPCGGEFCGEPSRPQWRRPTFWHPRTAAASDTAAEPARACPSAPPDWPPDGSPAAASRSAGRAQSPCSRYDSAFPGSESCSRWRPGGSRRDSAPSPDRARIPAPGEPRRGGRAGPAAWHFTRVETRSPDRRCLA